MRWLASHCWLVVLCQVAVAQAELEVRVEPQTVQVGGSFLITVRAKGGSVEEPELPEFDGIVVDQAASIRQDSWNLTKFQQVQVKVRGYRAIANRTGSATIPPISVVIDGKTYRSEPIKLVVTDAAALPPRPGPASEKLQPEPPADRGVFDLKDSVILDVEVDKTEVCVNEAILLTLSRWEVFSHVIRVYPIAESQPETPGFYVIPVYRDRLPLAPDLEMRDGWRYRLVQNFRVLYPTTVGELTIGPWAYQCNVRARQGIEILSRDLSLRTNPITITVRPLPEAPASFTGAVGQFEVRAAVRESEAVQGVPITLEIDVVGEGNPNAIGQPRLPVLDGALIADPATQVSPLPDPERLLFRKTFTYGVTPQRAGVLEIPSFEFSYFDPERDSYVANGLGPFSIRVVPASRREPRLLVDQALPQEEGSVNVVGVDILPIITETSALEPYQAHPLATPVAIVAPVAAYAGFVFTVARRRRFEQDPGLARAYGARLRGRKRLRELAKAKDPAEELYRALAGFIADKLGVPEAGVTSSEARQLLQGCGVGRERTENVTKILRACERARYASEALSKDEFNALVQGAAVSMDELDSLLGKGRRS